MKVINEIDIQERNGIRTEVGKSEVIKIESHKDSDNLINIIIDQDEVCIAVRATELISAIKNAVNWRY